MPKVLNPEASYIFHSYFEMRYNIADILADLGFRYDRRRLDLPASDRPFNVARIEETLDRNLRYAEPSSEAARREILIAPILIELCKLIGILERTQKQIIQDIKLYRVPENVEQLLQILIAVSQTG